MLKTLRLIFFACLVVVSAAIAAAQGGGVLVEAVKVDGVINPVTAEFLEKAVNKAVLDKAEAVVVQLDTPGGLDSSMRLMVKTIIGSPVPVITYVGPSGARAASAGVFIMMASPVAAMSPGTNIGAAHPVAMGGENIEGEMAKKIENDASAYIMSLAQKNGRNAQWAEQSVRESVSISESEALKKNVVDLVADNMDDLMTKLDGRKVVTAFGEKTLHTKGAKVEWFEMGARLRLLKAISDPNVAYVLMMIGMLGLFFELSNPGLILPGVLGGMSLILAFYSLQTLPVNYAGMMLILLAVVFFIAEVKVTSYGLLAVAGVISLVLGSVMLIDSPLPYMRISLTLILPIAATLTAFFMILVRAAIRARNSKVTTGSEGIVGATGDARTDIEPGGEGEVYVMGSYWSAHSDTAIRKGDKVVVAAIEGLKLKVTGSD